MGDRVYKIASVLPANKCNIVSPFYYEDIEKEYDSNLDRVIPPEEIKTIKENLIKITNTGGGKFVHCCDPAVIVNPKTLEAFKAKFPSIREIKKNGVLSYIELSTKSQNPSAGWKEITPYLLCKLSESNVVKTNDPVIFKTASVLDDCYNKSCNKDTISIDHLFNTVQTDGQYTYFDDLKVVESIKEGNMDGLTIYLRKYNNANTILTNDDFGNRLIHIGARYYKPDIFNLLITVGAKLNVKNISGNTPLHIACKYGNLDAITTLLKHNVERNPKNNAGETPIMFASVYNAKDDLNLVMVRVLYNNGGCLIDKDKKGNTILHHIINKAKNNEYKRELVKYVLERGVSAEDVNNAGVTSLELVSTKLQPVTTTAPQTTNAQVYDKYYKDTEIQYKKNDVFPIKTLHYGEQMDFPLTQEATSTTTMVPVHAPTPEADGFFTSLKKRVSGLFGYDGFEVNLQNLNDNDRVLAEIQTLLFNDIVKSNRDKYDQYINVTELPKGAPIEVLNYVCNGDNPEIKGIEDRAKCEAMGGTFVKVKKPSTLVKVELIPDNDIVLSELDDEDLYYPKGDDIIKSSEMFTDYSESYLSRDAIIGKKIDMNDLTGDKPQIYDNSYSIPAGNQIQDGDNPVENKLKFVNIMPPVQQPAYTLANDWQLVLACILLIIILFLVVYIWFKPRV